MTVDLPELTLDIGTSAPLQLKKILVPTDFSEGALKAVRYGIRLAQQFDASLSLLHIFQTPEFCYETAGIGDFSAVLETAKQQRHQRLESLRKAIERCHQVSVEAAFRQGTAYEEIARTAREQESDLIVISTHGFSGLKRLVRMGSTAERIVRHAPCPVIVVRENERDFVA